MDNNQNKRASLARYIIDYQPHSISPDFFEKNSIMKTLAVFFSIIVEEIVCITNENVSHWQEVNKKYKVGDQAKQAVLKIADKEDLDRVYKKRLHEFIASTTDTIEKDFIDLDLKKVDDLLNVITYRTDDTQKWYGLLNRYKDLLHHKLDVLPSAKTEAQKINSITSFRYYLNEDGQRILPELIKLYKDAKPKKISYMAFALKDLEIIPPSALSNISTLHRALTNDFGDIGTRVAFNNNIMELHSKIEYKQGDLIMHINTIKGLLTRNNKE